MKVKCLFNKGDNLPGDCLKPRAGFNDSTEFHLLINKQYIVYAMTINLGYIWYYICDEAYSYYPIWNPSPLFEVVDGKISKYWIYSFKRGKNLDETNVVMAFPEWARDSEIFYDKLSDGEENEVNIFKKYKILMDLEFPDESIKEQASIIENDWIMCPVCSDAWQVSCIPAMVECPSCKKILHNPKYNPGR